MTTVALVLIVLALLICAASCGLILGRIDAGTWPRFEPADRLLYRLAVALAVATVCLIVGVATTAPLLIA